MLTYGRGITCRAVDSQKKRVPQLSALQWLQYAMDVHAESMSELSPSLLSRWRARSRSRPVNVRWPDWLHGEGGREDLAERSKSSFSSHNPEG
eukprot:6474495-Amphidinium_carterae.2